ncbi:transcription factor HIVEP2a [Pygocentrus nattereri]|uniref:C2H2-type domain-containing protein n=1 Tax=Pygocentrus nattereri TaxID=42514 RepID=A0A3B4D8I1_PYGNA|nr:transcription factor HIVEP2a [Pygocentrus nattereri]XP_017556567.2 transcription factor HIVEP2a [Pygocentrus nattereri]XP_017556568.2 transcription factor HIVEP2a [Pygocentrus nattereri]XP_017556570.2 transcription factor HIVEP2a [Pygocentrus nattereri]XP_037393973.1 transcription factor HIVEP2a [Pygocentrus nattereri]
MEPRGTDASQKCSKEPREKNPLQRKWVSEPSTGTKRSIYAESEGKRHLHHENLQSGASGTGITGSGKLLLNAVSQSSQESQFFPRSYSFQLPHSYPQQPMQKPFLTGTKPQPGLEAHAWPFPGQLQSLPPDDMFPVHSRSHGVFPRQKSPSLPSAFGQYSQSGSEQQEEGHKKEQKPKKPGKYICQYCGRACAKPSVLKKHIRSHTGERPYPCGPCGFSFKTKSNLYKHRKSHAHAIKAGLVPFSELATRTDIDQASSVGETEVHSDGEQSTDTDEETAEGTMYPDKSSPVPQISFESDKSTIEKGGEPAYADSAEELAMASMKVPLLIVPKQGLPSTTIECTPFTEMKGSHIGGQLIRGDDSHTIKQRLALRLNEKKGQDSEQSLNLLSPHSKGSTDSGYFSRSESAEQQISPPNTNAKSYEEIMFGRTWYYRPNSRSRQAITVSMAASASQDPHNKSCAMMELDMGKISEDHIFFRGGSAESHMVAGCDPKLYPGGPLQSNAGLLEAPSESGTLIRSNSMPTPSPTNLNVPPGLRGSHSFDEMMSPDDVFYPGAAGLRRLRRQAAFEHGESENYGKITGPAMKVSERGLLMSEVKGSGSELACPEIRTAYSTYGTKIGMSELTTRKRRKEKSVGDEEDCAGQYDDTQSGSIETVGDYDLKPVSQESSRATPTGKGSMYSGYSPSESFDKSTSICPEEVVLVQDPDRKAVGNVISVIQHTNSLSRPNSFEKSESIEHASYQPEKPFGQLSEQSDTENIEDVQSPDSLLRSESMEHQQHSDSELASSVSSQQYHMPHKLVRQPNIQVPEIRVTEEPDKPEKEPEAPSKEPEKHVEEFQWPQRSETLSQLPAEKLPPKKKRLRLADMEHSSGESSFESTCTSLSRSPSQESNLSHSSSFSMSFDREESMKSVSPTKQDEFSKQSEFLTVPGSGHSLSIPGHHHKEMRRSSSEQAPCALPTEVPEIRSKSFDYGSLSTSSRQGEVYASASAMKERRRGYLVRQASLSVYPEVVLQEQVSELNIKQEHSDQHGSLSSWQGTSSHSAVGSDLGRAKRSSQPVLGSHQLLQQSISEDSQSEDLLQKSPHLPGQLSSDSEASVHEHMAQDVMQTSLQSSLASSAFLPFQTVFWHPESTQRPKQHVSFQTHQLPKLHIRQPNMQPMLQKSHQPIHQIQGQSDLKIDGASQSYPYLFRASPQNVGTFPTKVLTTSSVFLQQVQPVFATQNVGSQPSLPGMMVPVRIQTNVPSYGSVMYTSVSQILATHAQSNTSVRIICSDNASTGSLGMSSKHPIGFNLSKILGHPETSLQYPLWKVPEPLSGRMNTGIPLSLTSGTISTTDASSNIGGSKRMLSPASSLELFIETKQQKRVKEEKMYGQIVKELSAVELSNSSASRDGDASPQSDLLKRDDSVDDQERMSSSPPANFPPAKFPVRPCASHLPDVPPAESFTPPLQIVTNASKRAESPEELDVDESTPEASSSPQSMVSSSDTQEELKQTMGSKMPVNMLVQLAASQSGSAVGSTLLLTDLADVQQFFQFPSLRTTTSVSWCFLNYTKPNYAQTTPVTSVYGSWCVSSYNPNPLSLSTKATLALLRSKQRRNTETYTMAAMYQPGTGKLVSSLLWKQNLEQMKPELMQLDVGKFGKKMKGVNSRDRGKEDHGEKEASSKQHEPTRIKIFEGGYKSNEDYVYVRGRGRGKYICEECGIRCKKPSMLKKHIRTHTDVRPYVCKFCNFAFKTKGNLTKHMKSKAHMKKCLELGVSETSVDDADAEETDPTEEVQREPGKIDILEIMAKHQFSDADDSDGPEEDGDEGDEDEEDDDDYDGDSTPKTRSRSTSPQPYVIPSHSVTAVAASQEGAPELLGTAPKQPLFGYFTSLPSIQITQLVPSEKAGEAQMAEYQKLLQGALGEDYRTRLEVPSSMDEDFGLSPEHSSSSFDFSSSRLSSPGCDSSPLREPSPSRRYLSPRRDLSPRGRLSPRREASPLRPLSPRRDVYRRDLSPRRDLSSRGHLSPISHAGRPTSPGRELSTRRELSPRSRHKGIIRPLSPRRGLHHHSGPWTLNQHPLGEMISSQKSRSHSEKEMDQRKNCHHQGDVHSTESPCAHTGGLFSHLPLHSQQQVRMPLPMIPIGGIQMVHSVTGLAHPTRLPLQKSTSEESSTSEVSFHLSEGRGANNSSQSAEDSSQPQEKAASPKSTSSAPSPSSQNSREVSKEQGDKESRQEESIQTCTKAIASLCIASEEPLEKLAGPVEQFHQTHSPTAQQESAPSRLQHFSSSEIRHPSHSGTESGVSATSKMPAEGQSPLYSAEVAEKSPSQQGHGEKPASTKKDKESTKDNTDNR